MPLKPTAILEKEAQCYLRTENEKSSAVQAFSNLEGFPRLTCRRFVLGFQPFCSLSALVGKSNHISWFSTNLTGSSSMKEGKKLAFFQEKSIFSQIATCPQKAIVEGNRDDCLEENIGLKPFSKKKCFFFCFLHVLDPYSIKSFANHFS